MDIQREIRRAITRIRAAHEILAGLTVSDDESMRDLLRVRAESQGTHLTETELEVISRFIGGQPPASIAEERGLSERTIGNQLRTGSHKLGFKDRRELKGWVTAVNSFILTEPPEESEPSDGRCPNQGARLPHSKITQSNFDLHNSSLDDPG